MDERAAGILLHPTSLPGTHGIGDLGPGLDRFIDWAAAAGQRVWQVLPLGPTGHHHVPYACGSSCAGNPLLVSPELLVRDGLLPAYALEGAPVFPAGHVDFGGVAPWRESLLLASWEHAGPDHRHEVLAFLDAPERRAWLPDWTLFAALKERFEGRPWWEWEREFARREPAAIERARGDLAPRIAYHAWVQYLFFRQWDRARRAAAERGIRILGDLPIYPAPDSADVWASQEYFALDADGKPEAVAGVPPDYFSETGQLWGFFLYRWERIEADGFRWWIERVRGGLALCDVLRIDHFRGLVSYWAVPAGEPTAVNGEWLPGPGRRLFDALRGALGAIPIVAEDLGMITEDVRTLLAELDIPGMKVLQFGFSEPDSEHLPHRHIPRLVAYTGTHDNDTARGWFASLAEEDRARALEYLGGDGNAIEWDLIRALYESVARWAIVPMQDVLGLGSEARMNTPALRDGNWGWRMPEDGFRDADAARLRRLAVMTGRAAPTP